MRKIIILLLLMLFIFGCLQEYQILFSDKMVLSDKIGVDLTNNGEIDIGYYMFSPLSVSLEGKSTKLLIEKWIFIYPYKIDMVIKNKYNPTAITELSSELKLLDNVINGEESECKEKLNFDLCNDYLSCYNACYLPICHKNNTRKKEIGEILYDFKSLVIQRNKDLELFKNALITLKLTNSTEDASYALTDLYIRNKIIEQHPAVKKLGLCSPHYSENMYRAVKKYLANFTIKQEKFIVYYSIIPSDINGVIEIKGEDKLPNALSTRVEKLSTLDDYIITSQLPITIKFPNVKMSSGETTDYVYSVLTNSDVPSLYLEVWLGGDITISRLALRSKTLNTLLAHAYNIYKKAYNETKLSYFSFSVVLLILIIILMFIKELSYYLYNLTSYLSQNISTKLALKKAFGEADISAKQDLIYGIIIGILSLIVEVFASKGLYFKSFGIFVMKQTFNADPISLFVVLGYSTSFYFILCFLFDALKGLLAGKEYYAKVIALSPIANKKLLDKLKKDLDDALNLAQKLAKEGVEISKSYEFFASVPINRLEDLYNKNMLLELNKELNYYLSRITDEKSKLESMYDTALEKLPTWMHYLAKELEERNAISLDNLIAIPRQWRIWVVNRYIKEHPDEELILEGDLLRKEKLSPGEKVKKTFTMLMKKFNFIGGFVFKNNILLASSFNVGKESVFGVLSYKLFALNAMLGNVDEINAYGKFYIAKMLKIRNITVFFIAGKADLENIEKQILKKFNKL